MSFLRSWLWLGVRWNCGKVWYRHELAMVMVRYKVLIWLSTMNGSQSKILIRIAAQTCMLVYALVI